MTSQEKQSRFFFVRHGQSHANVSGVWHGQTDTALTDTGHTQAQLVGEHFHKVATPDVVYSSPLQRARITAESIAAAFDLKVKQDPRLMEFHLGDWEDRRFRDLEKEHNLLHRLQEDPDFCPPNGESQSRVYERVTSAIEEIRSQHPQQTIVMVSHGVTMGIALSHYIHGNTRRWLEFHSDNTGITEFCPQRGLLLDFNRTDHLSTLD